MPHILMAFDSAKERQARVYNTVMAGLAKLVPDVGTEKLYLTMKGYYGAGVAFKQLMDCDAVLLKDIKTAYGYRDGRVFQFTANRNEEKGGWDCSFKEVTVQQEITNLLKSHAALEMRVRSTALEKSSLISKLMESRTENEELRKEIKEQNNTINHLTNEVKYLREQYRQRQTDHKTIVDQIQVNNRVTWNNMLLAIVLIILALLITPGNAQVVDCRNRITGCYVEQGEGKPLTYTEFIHICFGQTNTVLKTGQVQIDQLVKQCEQQMQGMNFDEDVVSHWCKTQIQERVNLVVCDKKDLITELKEQWYTIKACILEETWINPIIENASHLIALMMIILGGNPLINFLVYGLGVLLGIPPFMLAIAITTFPPISFAFIVIATIFPHGIHPTTMGVFLLHWIIGTLYVYAMSEDALTAVSAHLFYTILAPLWYIANLLVTYYNIKTSLQILVFVVGITWSIGLKYLNSTVIITTPGGETIKQKRIKLVADSVKKGLVRLQSLRGVIPPIPDRAEHVVRIDSDNGSGVGFRYMNNIYTLGHVVGSSKHVRITWNKISVLTQVVKEQQIWDTTDSLVAIRLPAEMQSLKPLRMSKIYQSDYMALVTINANDQISQFSGWCMIDGNWISNSFETYPGTSGSPYVDRYGRLVGIHMGTQGVVGQGYMVSTIMKEMTNIVEKPTENENVGAQTIRPESNINMDQLADTILEKLIAGTRASHAALLAEIEKLNERVKQLEKTTQEPISKEKKKPANRFAKMKILTEEEYQRMLDDGWTKEEIDDAVRQLREAAWIEYEDQIDEDFDKRIDDEFSNFLQGQRRKRKKGEPMTIKDVVINEARRLHKKKRYHCHNCKRDYDDYHNYKECVAKNSKRGVAPPN
nr:MAG: NSP1a protein [Avian astrovirus 9]